MRFLVSCVALFIILNVYGDIVESHAGRSGQFVILPKQREQDSFLAIPGFSEAWESISEAQVGGYLSHSLGTALVGKLPPSNQFSIFKKPRATILYMLDGFSRDDFSPQLRSEDFILVNASSYIRDSTAFFESAMTGTLPYYHGVVGKKWINNDNGKVKAAHEDSKSSRFLLKDSVTDILSTSYGGESFMCTLSSDQSLLGSISYRCPLVDERKPHSHAYFYNVGSKSFVEHCTGEKYGVTMFEVSEVLKEMGVNNVIASNVITLFEDYYKAEFNLNEDADGSLLGELVGISRIIAHIESNIHDKQIKDPIPDFYGIGFASVRKIKGKYGINSPEWKASCKLINVFINNMNLYIKKLYNDDVNVCFLSAGLNEYSKKWLSEGKIDELKEIPSVIIHDEYLPEIYLTKRRFATDSMHSTIRRIVESDDLEVFKVENIRRSTQKKNNNDDGDSPSYTYDQVASFQIILWISIILILVLLTIAYNMASMDYSRDNMIFSHANPRHVHAN